MNSFRIIIDYASGSYSAYCASAPDIVSVGPTPERALQIFREMLAQYVEDEEDIRYGMSVLARIKDHPEELLDAEEVFQELGL